MSDNFIQGFLSNSLNSQTKESITQTDKSLSQNIVFPNVEYKTTKAGFKYSTRGTILKLDNISLKYDKVILRDINLSVENIIRPDVKQGQIISMVGRSGVGKTQLFKIMAGLNKPTTGSVLVGRELKSVASGDFGVIPQNYLLFNHRTIKKNLEISANNNKNLPKSDIKDKINMYVEKFGIADKLDKYPLELSGGQRQRVSIIQQILNGGDFFLFDEPFSGLDAVMINKVLSLLHEVSIEDDIRTLIIVSHDIETACSISDNVIILGTEPDKEGAIIKKQINLLEKGFVWKPINEVRKDREFLETIEEIKRII